MATADGAGTRQVDHGASLTRFAVRTSPSAPRNAVHPMTRASSGDAAWLSEPPPCRQSCARAIRGIAPKFSTRPANVTRPEDGGRHRGQERLG